MQGFLELVCDDLSPFCLCSSPLLPPETKYKLNVYTFDFVIAVYASTLHSITMGDQINLSSSLNKSIIPNESIKVPELCIFNIFRVGFHSGMDWPSGIYRAFFPVGRHVFWASTVYAYLLVWLVHKLSRSATRLILAQPAQNTPVPFVMVLMPEGLIHLNCHHRTFFFFLTTRTWNRLICGPFVLFLTDTRMN